MEKKFRGKSNATSYQDLQLILKLSKVTTKDIFCDLGCGNGNLCRWASKKVQWAHGTEDSKKRFDSARRNIRKYECKNVTILNEDYRSFKTLKRVRNGTIFYCTNDESLGFFRKFQNIVMPKTRLIIYYLPPYPLKPDSFDDWFYLLTTPFKIAKTKKEWIQSVTKKNSLHGLKQEIKHDFFDYEERFLDLEEGFDAVYMARIAGH